MLKKFIWIIFLVLFASSLWATDYYVDFDGSNGDGSIGTPWNNWASAKKSGGTVSNGDTVYLKGTPTGSSAGTTFTSSDAGGSGAEITYQTWAGSTLTLDGNDYGTSVLKFDDGAAYLNFIGSTPSDRFDSSTYKFIITDDGEGLAFGLASTSAAHHLVFRYIAFTYIDGYSAITTNQGIVENVTVDHCYFDTVGDSNAEHGMYWEMCDNCTITHNIVYSSSGNGINFQARYGLTSDSTVIAYNYVYGSGRVGNGYGIRLSEYSNTANQCTNFKIYNNFIWGNAREGLYHWSQVTGNVWYNNSVWNNSRGYASDGTAGGTVRNNIFYGNTNASILTGTTNSNNISNSTDPNYGSTTYGNSEFLKLTASSTNCIDSGYDVSSVVTDDMFGTARDASIDIGAHEYVAAPVSATSTAGIGAGLR